MNQPLSHIYLASGEVVRPGDCASHEIVEYLTEHVK